MISHNIDKIKITQPNETKDRKILALAGGRLELRHSALDSWYNNKWHVSNIQNRYDRVATFLVSVTFFDFDFYPLK